jgi:hypothetical protein
MLANIRNGARVRTVVVVLVACASCGGKDLNVGGSPPGGTLAGGADWQIVPYPADDNRSGVVGSSPNDLWAAYRPASMVHWDGKSWTTLPLPAPLAMWDAEDYASAGAGAVWISNKSGFGRMDANGNWTDFTSEVGDVLEVESASPSAHTLVISQALRLFRFDGAHFSEITISGTTLGQAVGAISYFRVGWDGSGWLQTKSTLLHLGTDGGVQTFDYTMGDTRPLIVAHNSAYFFSTGDDPSARASICPAGWCNPGPPYPPKP